MTGPSNPPTTLNPTTEQLFCTCRSSYPPLFTVRPGIDAVDALVYASLLARGIQEIADTYAQQHAPDIGRGMIWSVQHLSDMLRALLEGVLDSIDA